jgi:uncharacterized membrane protein YesL
MNGFFNMDSPFMRLLTKVADLIILNILVILCSIPIVTMGASLTGMHYVLLKMVRNEDGYIVKGFFKSFKQNFKQATIIWLIIIAFAAVLVVDWLIYKQNAAQLSKVMMIILVALVMVVGMGISYVFPVLSRFDNTVFKTIKNSIFMAILSFPKTVLMITCYAIPFLLLWYVPSSVPVVLMLGISGPAYLAAMIYNGIFKKFEPAKEEEVVTSDQDFRIEPLQNTEATEENAQENETEEMV